MKEYSFQLLWIVLNDFANRSPKVTTNPHPHHDYLFQLIQDKLINPKHLITWSNLKLKVSYNYFTEKNPNYLQIGGHLLNPVSNTYSWSISLEKLIPNLYNGYNWLGRCPPFLTRSPKDKKGSNCKTCFHPNERTYNQEITPHIILNLLLQLVVGPNISPFALSVNRKKSFKGVIYWTRMNWKDHLFNQKQLIILITHSSMTRPSPTTLGPVSTGGFLRASSAASASASWRFSFSKA